MWKAYKTVRPNDDDMYIVAWKPVGAYLGRKHFYALWEFDPKEDEFIIEGAAKEDWGEFEIEILAWMELPGEYKGDEMDEN